MYKIDSVISISQWMIIPFWCGEKIGYPAGPYARECTQYRFNSKLFCNKNNYF